MNKQLLLIPALALSTMASCGGGGSATTQQPADTTSKDDTPTTAAAPETPFQYTEPAEDIAGKIFRAVAQKDFDHEIYDALKNVGNDAGNCSTSLSNSHNQYYFEDYSTIDNYQHNDLVCVKCYQSRKSGWIGIVAKSLNTWAEYDIKHRYDIYTVLYDNGKVTRIDSTTVFPPEMLSLVAINNEPREHDQIEWDFSDTYFESKSGFFWNVRFNWNGEKFTTDPETPLVANLDPGHTGNFQIAGAVDKAIKLQNIDPKKDLDADGVLKSADGSPLAQFIIKDGQIDGYKILSKKLGLARYYDQLSGKPIALGHPIQNVFANNKDTSLKTSEKDGKYVVTMLSYHNTYGLQDIFYEYTAKDKNSPIDGIAVYSKPFTVDLTKEITKYNGVPEELKEMLIALNVTEKIKDPGAFKRLYGSKTHFDLSFTNGSYRFQVYPAKESGSKYVMLIKEDSMGCAQTETAQWWIYENGKYTPVQITFPEQPTEEEYYRLVISDNGLSFNGEDDYQSYKWDGSQFVKD